MEAGPLFCNREFPCTLLGITIGFDYGHQVEGGLRPELPRFAGIIVYMLFRDAQQHNKPHVHVHYGEYEVSVGVDGELLAGSLPRRQLKIVVGWLALHEEEVYAA